MPPALSSSMTLKRIHREVADLKKEDLGPIVLAPSDDNLYLWKGSIPGPEGSVYENGVFDFEIVLAPDYPQVLISPPKVVFKTRIYHMNDLMVYDAVPSIANQYTRNRKAHDAIARQWTELYARPKPPAPSSVPILSAKAKGKQKASDVPSGSSTSSPASTLAEPITIEDSDDERKHLLKRGTAKNSKRKREEQPEINLVDDDDHVEVSDNVSASKKRAVGTGRIPRKSMTDNGSGRSQPLMQLGDVIVLDDD
ncbi:hypothetical protein C0992_003777 [Termitomyces sp. T32_za158]|nr:hypothetical protein C0992_003777 [Termitomyces sp. T32_za158]